MAANINAHSRNSPLRFSLSTSSLKPSSPANRSCHGQGGCARWDHRPFEDPTLSRREPKCHFLPEAPGNSRLLQALHTFITSHCCWLSLLAVFISTKKQFIFPFHHRLKVTTCVMLGSPILLGEEPGRSSSHSLRPHKHQTQVSKMTSRGGR